MGVGFRAMEQTAIDEAALERRCLRAIQSVDRGRHSAPRADSDEHRLWDSTVIAVGWMYMELERAVVELESAMAVQRDDGLLPTRAGADGAATPLIATIARMIYHAARSRQRSLEGRLARLVPALDRFHRVLEQNSRRHLVLRGPSDDGVRGPRYPAPEQPRLDVGQNALLVQADSDLADIAIHTGFPTRLVIARRTHRAQALAAHLWHEEHRTFCNRLPDGGWVEPPDEESLLPLFSGSALGLQARAMMADGPGPAMRFGLGSPSGEPVSPAASSEVSPLLTWLLIRGLYRYGFEDQAREQNDRLLAAASQQGLREAFDAQTGEGVGDEDSPVTAALILDLIKTPYHYDRW